MDTNAISSPGILSELSIREKQPDPAERNALGQDAFLQLMITQMNNQNPLDPQSNSEFVAQLAQFSSVEGLDKLNNAVGDMAASFQSSQALQASSMVGRAVKVDSETAYLGASGQISGTIDLPYSTHDLNINIYNTAGQLVSQQRIGAQPAGDIAFVWNGQNNDGNALPAGKYRFEAVASSNGKYEQLGTALSANVDSVTVGSNGTLTLNVAGVGPVGLSGVKEIL